MTYDKERWSFPVPFTRIPNSHRLVIVPTTTKFTFTKYFMHYDCKLWEMTQAQRETWKNEILKSWERYKHVLHWDGTKRHYQQLKDMNGLGGGVILITGHYGTGKSIIALTIAKQIQILKYNSGLELKPISVYWRKNKARSEIRKADNDTIHVIDEDMKATGTGSHNMEVHIQNIFETVRKTGKFVVEAGVNLTPSNHKKAIALLIEPFGFNRKFQANRIIVKDYAGNPLWLAVTQRNYLPSESVLYEGKKGTFAQYNSRAIEFSSNTSGVFSGSTATDEKTWKDKLVDYWIKKYGKILPSVTELEYHAIQIGIPPESVASIRRVCSTARRDIRRQIKFSSQDEQEIEVSEVGWKGLRESLEKLILSKGISKRDSSAASLYYVPTFQKMKYKDIIDAMGLDIQAGSIGKQIRTTRKEITTKEIGDIGENFTASHIDNLTPRLGGGGANVPDILCTIDGTEVALNVKLSLEEGFRREVSSTPENEWEHSLLVVLLPRLLEIRLYPITGQMTMVNSRLGVLSTPELLEESIRGMM